MGVRLWRSLVSKSELPRIGGSLDNLKNQTQSRQMDERGIPSKGVFTKGRMTSR